MEKSAPSEGAAPEERKSLVEVMMVSVECCQNASILNRCSFNSQV